MSHAVRCQAGDVAKGVLTNLKLKLNSNTTAIRSLITNGVPEMQICLLKNLKVQIISSTAAIKYLVTNGDAEMQI